MAEKKAETEQERFEKLRAAILKVGLEHERRMKEDPEYRASYEDFSRRLDDFYTAGRKPYKSNEK